MIGKMDRGHGMGVGKSRGGYGQGPQVVRWVGVVCEELGEGGGGWL